MADVIQFPSRPSLGPPSAEIVGAREYAVDAIQDLAEVLDWPGNCGLAEVLRVLSKVLFERYGAERTLDLLETAQFYVGALRDRTPPPGDAA
jgi:hypothetical protein